MLPQNIFSRNFWTSSIKFIAKIAISLHWYSAEKPTSEGLGREERRKVSRGYQHFFLHFPQISTVWWLVAWYCSDPVWWWLLVNTLWRWWDDNSHTGPSSTLPRAGIQRLVIRSSSVITSTRWPLTALPGHVTVINLHTISAAHHQWEKWHHSSMMQGGAGSVLMSQSREGCSSRI